MKEKKMFQLKLKGKKPKNKKHINYRESDPVVHLNRNSPVIEKILEDKRIKKLFKMKEEGIFAVDTAKYIDDLEDLLVLRKFRNVKITEYMQSAINRSGEWILETSAQRGRVVSIWFNCLKAQRELDEQLKTARNYIMTKYSDELKRQFGLTIKNRQTVADFVLEPFYKLHHKLDTVLQLAKGVMDDLDKAYWSANTMVEALKINYGKG